MREQGKIMSPSEISKEMKKYYIVMINKLNYQVYSNSRPVARFFNETDAQEYVDFKNGDLNV